ncbi:hypothetical protein FIBSPDRAFT_850462, partial [Athelia psychrophila]
GVKPLPNALSSTQRQVHWVASATICLCRVSVTAESAVTDIPKEPSGRYPRWAMQYNRFYRRSPRARPPWMSGR